MTDPSRVLPDTTQSAAGDPGRRFDHGLAMDLLRSGEVFRDFSLERWLDRIERREETE